MLKKESKFVQEFRVVRADGEVRWLAAHARILRDAAGNPTHVQGGNYDITSRKQMEEALRNSEAEAHARADELATLMDTVPAITIIAHDPQCHQTSASRKTRQLLRVPEGMEVSLSAPESVRPKTRRYIKDGRELAPEELPLQMAARGKEVHNFEVTVLFNDGISRDLVGEAVPLFNENGEVRGSILAYSDITEYKAIQRDLQKAHDELEQRVVERTAELQKETEERIATLEALRERDKLLIHQSRLAAMGEILNNIAHHWRQPLNVMGLIVQELPMMYKTDAFTEEYLKEQVDKAKSLIFDMSETIEQFKNFFKPSKRKAEFNVSDMIAAALALVENVLKDLQIKVEVEQVGNPIIYGYFTSAHRLLSACYSIRKMPS